MRFRDIGILFEALVNQRQRAGIVSPAGGRLRLEQPDHRFAAGRVFLGQVELTALGEMFGKTCFLVDPGVESCRQVAPLARRVF